MQVKIGEYMFGIDSPIDWIEGDEGRRYYRLDFGGFTWGKVWGGGDGKYPILKFWSVGLFWVKKFLINTWGDINGEKI